MVIRCERCSTLYELDEKLLSPSGSQVQCTRCQHVFTAFPTGAGSDPASAPAPQAPAPEIDAPAASAPAAPAAPSLPRARSAPRYAGGANGARPEQKPVRTAPPPVYRPPSAAAAAPVAGVQRGPMLQRDTMGAFEARLRRSARLRWLAPAAAVALAVVVAAAWLLLARLGHRSGARAHDEAIALAALDDGASLDQAIARLEELERRSPAAHALAAERALVQVLRAGALAEDADALGARLAGRSAERERLRRDQPAGWEEAERAAATDVEALEPEVRARADRSRALGAAALETLRRVERAAGATPEVARGLAAYHALAGERDRVHAIVRARGAARDPWVDLASAWADAREPDRATRERALSSLGALAGAHPEILRGRYLLARTEASLGRRAQAIATLDGVLAANPRHEAARRLRDELGSPAAVAAPVAPAVAPAVAASAPAAGKAATQPRKPASHPPPAGVAPPPEPLDPAATSASGASAAAPGAPEASPGALDPAAQTPQQASAPDAAPAPEPAPPPRPAPRPAPEPDPSQTLNGG